VPEEIVLLHGFAGTRRTWDGVIALLSAAERYRPHAFDLPGHGSAADVRPISFESCVAHVLDAAPPSFALCGYSMGGRIALHVALAAPERVCRLILVSCSAGVEDGIERERRRLADSALADQLEQGSFEVFIERWRAQPLFADDPPEVGELARAEMRRNSPAALAASLRGVGAGEMRPLWPRLGELRMPVTFIAGERDAKFVAVGRRLAAAVADGSIEVLPGGHALALESPARLAEALERY
jgi:2-succinyl-6-hydroxy-2,4-cyclohexadiene-1-carboxylate synthase